jgi:hypothetical protein
MKRYRKNIKKTISNVAGHLFDFILQNIFEYLRLLICEIAFFINFKRFFFVSPTNFLRRFSTPNRSSNFRMRNSYSHQKKLIIWRNKLNVGKIEFRNNSRKNSLRNLCFIHAISMRRSLNSSSNYDLHWP